MSQINLKKTFEEDKYFNSKLFLNLNDNLYNKIDSTDSYDYSSNLINNDINTCQYLSKDLLETINVTDDMPENNNNENDEKIDFNFDFDEKNNNNNNIEENTTDISKCISPRTNESSCEDNNNINTNLENNNNNFNNNNNNNKGPIVLLTDTPTPLIDNGYYFTPKNFKINEYNNINNINNNYNNNNNIINNMNLNINNNNNNININNNNLNNNNYINNEHKKTKKTKLKERDGDWTCFFCKNLNFSFRKKCNRCSIEIEKSEKLYDIYMENLKKLINNNFQNFNYNFSSF
jgi:hypothetical protein